MSIEAEYIPFHGVLEGIPDKVEHDLFLIYVSPWNQDRANDRPNVQGRQRRCEELNQLRRYISI